MLLPAPTRSPLSARLLRAALAALAAAALPAAALEAHGTGPAERAAADMSPQQLIELARFFETSQPPSRDLLRARMLYCRAAAGGHRDALERLGWIYARGDGVPADDRVAATLFRLAGDFGHAGAAALSRKLPAGAEVLPQCLQDSGGKIAATLRRRMSPGATVANPDTPFDLDAVRLPAQHRALALDVIREARRYRLDPRLVLAVMRVESNFDVRARSPKNAHGLMQLIPETAARFNVRDIYDPLENIRGGMAYLRWLLAYYGGNVQYALAAYNAGEGAVDRHRGIPPYAETISYVQRIRAVYPFDRHPFDPAALGERGPSAIAVAVQ